MTLQETIQTMIRWTQSCVNQEQLDLLDNAIDRLVILPFKNHPDIYHETSKLFVAMSEQSKLVIQPAFPVLNMN